MAPLKPRPFQAFQALLERPTMQRSEDEVGLRTFDCSCTGTKSGIVFKAVHKATATMKSNIHGRSVGIRP